MKIRMLKKFVVVTDSDRVDLVLNKFIGYQVGEDLGKYLIKMGYAEEAREAEFVPYKEPKIEWIKKKVIFKKVEYTIVSITWDAEKWVIELSNDTRATCFSLDNAYRLITWSDGTPFGEQAGGE